MAAIVALGTAIALAVVPALAAQVAGTQSSATVLDAIIISLNVLVLGHGGGIMLAAGALQGSVTLTPLGMTLVLVLIAALGMRRVGHALELVREDGVLRERALRDAAGSLGAFAGVYTVGMGVIAAVSRSPETRAVLSSAVVSAALVAVVGGLLGLLWSVRRDPTDAVPGVRVLSLLPAPFDRVARAALIAVTGLLGSGAALVVVLLVISIPGQSGLFEQLSPGIVGGVVLTLLQLALLPLFIVWAAAVLLGGTVSVGTSTALSLGGSSTGLLPALPMLAAVPQPGDFPAWSWALMVVPAAAVALGAVQLVRSTAEHSLRDRITAWIAYPVAVIVAMLLVTGLAGGRIGDGRLVRLGPDLASLIGPLALVAVVASGIVIGLLATGLIPWSRDAVARLRSRVESAEAKERGEEEPAGGSADAADDADDEHGEDRDGTDAEVSAPPTARERAAALRSAASAASPVSPASVGTPASPSSASSPADAETRRGAEDD